MISFKKTRFTFSYDLEAEITQLRNHKIHRGIPNKTDNTLLLATWNIANLGLHHRDDDHYRLIAEILSWFDIIAIQEVHDNLWGLKQLENYIGTTYDLMYTDRRGNDERAAYFFDANKVQREQLTGELAIPPSSHRYIKIDGITSKFQGFDRNPFIASFKFQETKFILLNVHLFFGSNSKSHKERRALEAYAVGRYADLRRDEVHSFTSNIIALGDFNIPMAKSGDAIYDALVKRGLKVPEHSTRMASSISSDAQYDQVAFFPSLKRKIIASGVFDYDQVIFARLWEARVADFKNYCRYYISDHRPMWVQIDFNR